MQPIQKLAAPLQVDVQQPTPQCGEGAVQKFTQPIFEFGGGSGGGGGGGVVVVGGGTKLGSVCQNLRQDRSGFRLSEARCCSIFGSRRTTMQQHPGSSSKKTNGKALPKSYFFWKIFNFFFLKKFQKFLKNFPPKNGVLAFFFFLKFHCTLQQRDENQIKKNCRLMGKIEKTFENSCETLIGRNF